MINLYVILVFVTQVCLASMADNFTALQQEITFELKKRGLHEEFPLIFMANDHPLEYYWLPPYFPSRT